MVLLEKPAHFRVAIGVDIHRASGDTASAERAAQFLSTYGDADAKAALMSRLKTVRDHELEAALVSALLKGKAWTLTDDEKSWLLQRVQ